MDQEQILGQVIDDNYQFTAVIGSGSSSTGTINGGYSRGGLAEKRR